MWYVNKKDYTSKLNVRERAWVKCKQCASFRLVNKVLLKSSPYNKVLKFSSTYLYIDILIKTHIWIEFFFVNFDPSDYNYLEPSPGKKNTVYNQYTFSINFSNEV